jgi:hypothetical protein
VTDGTARKIAKLALEFERTRCQWTPGTSSGWQAHIEATRALQEACREVLDEESPPTRKEVKPVAR